MRTDVDAGIITAYQQDMTPCARITVENDLMPFSLYSGSANDPDNWWAHDAKTFTKSGTTYVLRARATGSDLQYQLLDNTEVLTAANWESWTSTGITEANIKGPNDCGVAVAVADTGKAQIFHFDDAGDLNVTECADVLAGSPVWGAPAQIYAAIGSTQRTVAACRLDECFFGVRGVVGSNSESLFRAYNSGGWAYKVWPLHSWWFWGKDSRGGDWGWNVWGGMGCVELDGKVLIALGALRQGNTGIPKQQGVFTFFFQEGAAWGDDGIWWDAGTISLADYEDDNWFFDLFVRASLVDGKAHITFRHEDEPTDLSQTETAQSVPRFRFVAYSRSGDGHHWSEMRYVTDNYQESGTGPLLHVDNYVYMPTYQDVYRAPATSKVGMTNSSVRATLDECYKAACQVSARRTLGRATLSIAEASNLNASTIVKPLSRVFIELGAVVSGTPTYEQIWQGRLASPDDHWVSEDPPSDERMITCADDLYQLTMAKAMDNVDYLPQERIADDLSDYSYVRSVGGTWKQGATTVWGTTICVVTIYDANQFAAGRGYGVAFVTHTPTLNGMIEADFAVHKGGGNDYGCGSDPMKAGLVVRGYDKHRFMMFYYDNQTDKLALGRASHDGSTGTTFDWVLTGMQTGALGWQNNSKRSLRVLVYYGRIVCQYKLEAATTWTHAFTYEFNPSAEYPNDDVQEPGYMGFFGHGTNEASESERSLVYFHNLRFAGGDYDKTVEELAKYCFAYGDVHDFSRFEDQISDDFAAALSTDDWKTATADGTWQATGGVLEGTAGASAWAELLCTETMTNPVVEWDMKLGSGEKGGVIVRALDEDNYMSLVVTQGAQGTARATLHKNESSVTTIDDCLIACGIPAGAWCHYTLFSHDNWIALWLERQLLAVFYDASPVFTAGYVGLCCYNCTVEFDDFRIPGMKEVPEFMTFDTGKDMLSTLNGMLGQRHIQLFMDYVGRPVMGYFGSRDGLTGGITYEDRVWLNHRVRQRGLTHCRVHGAEGWAEYWRESELDDGYTAYEDIHCPDIFIRSAMYDEARHHVRKALELSEQCNFDVRPDLRQEPEDVCTIVAAQQSINDQYVIDDITLTIEIGEQVAVEGQMGTRRYTVL